ncbi:pilin [Natronospirillum sp.]
MTALSGETIFFEQVASGGQIIWDCSGGSLPPRQRPEMCR